MVSTWTSDFIQQALMAPSTPHQIAGWCNLLVQSMREVKPDHQVFIFGVSRIPGMPNFLLAASDVKFQRPAPLPIWVNEKTAEVFLGPHPEGVRLLQEELPMTVDCAFPEQPDRRHTMSFYEAICFDGPHSSLVMGLLLTDLELSEFLAQDEIATLLPLIRSQAIPLLELYSYRDAHTRQSEEIRLMMGVMRDSTPSQEIRKLATSLMTPLPVTPARGPAGASATDSIYLQYLANELRQPLNQISSCAEVLMELVRGNSDPRTAGLLHKLSDALENENSIVRNLSNIASLSQPEVKPRGGVFPMQALMREIYPLAVTTAAPYKVRIKMEETTRNIYMAGDKDTILKMCERYMHFIFASTPGCAVSIRSIDSTDMVEPGHALLEIEDDAQIESELVPTQLLNRNNFGAAHPRLRRGGGILFQLLQLYMEKSGGKFRLSSGSTGYFAAHLVIPQVSRAEMERIKAGEI